ncbi:MAG: electron transport complex subunit E [Magnetococcales bacterium]|nr:electron transport complex subunit E [Magnetococcales bacterium]
MSDQAVSEQRKVFTDAFWVNNPIFAQMLGMCPTLAVTTNAINGVGMGLATVGVLVGSNVAIATIRNVIPAEVRIPAYVVVIAAFVTIIDLSMNAFVHDLHKVLGIFIPLIVVNCIILGRAEAFASKNTVLSSLVDGVASGLGFTLALVLLGSLREILGSGHWFGMDLFGSSYHPMLVFVLPPGAFLVLGLILAGVRWYEQQRKAVKQA